ncbi:hypothetical protein [Gelidibacter maritimus]|uniref:Uncharacterized protein n=1 Tax=Gelidibacter maritimus TaxID=2761487 RepID=A0A7W2M479_9FLAO|nr:hypothetical protein [Gelidibacter maritimus]MBA6152404.1 hypothetical protein [Gelidibacter maritimus]
METPFKSTALDSSLQEKLLQLTRELAVAQIFYHPATTSALAQLIVVMGEYSDVSKVASRKWVRRAREQFSVQVNVIRYLLMIRYDKIGNPFIAYYCHKGALIYKHPDASDGLEIKRERFKKRYHDYRERFHSSYDLLLTQARKFESLNAITSVFLIYHSTFKKHITYLETLYFGNDFFSDNLHQRIYRLSHVVPGLERLFVNSSERSYYLISQMEKAEKDAGNADNCHTIPELLANVQAIDDQLSKMVVDRFSELKYLIKKHLPSQTYVVADTSATTSSELAKIVSYLVKTVTPEEVYCFGTKDTATGLLYYLLLIGSGLGTSTLNRLQQSIADRYECEVVLIGHSRIWIQEHLYVHQQFFQAVMIPEHRVYPSASPWPLLHWRHPYTCAYPDLDYYFRATKKIVSSYFILRQHNDESTTGTLPILFSTCVLRILRTLVYSSTAYLPNQLSAFNLWQLCVYANSCLANTEFLFEKLDGKQFYIRVDKHAQYAHGNIHYTETQILVMDEILKCLFDTLTQSVEKIDMVNIGS